MHIIPGSTGIQFAEELQDHTDWPITVPEFKNFDDGELYLRVPGSVNDDVLVIQSLYYPQESNLFQLLNLVNTVKRHGSKNVTVFIPYMCYARADTEVFPGTAVSIHTVIALLEAVGVDHLITMDIHNPEIFEFAKNMKTTNFYPVKSMANFIENYIDTPADLQIIAPDEGAIHRAELIANELNIPFAYLNKVRDPESGSVNVEIGNAQVTSKRVVLIDDIMSTGSSLIQASSLLSLFDVTEIHVIVSHALGTQPVDKLREIGRGIIASTTSVPSAIANISPLIDLVQVLPQ
ncbi:MAG: ribose-phosphate diphosphokinase [Candidatus Kariarchaeaceae archaeon]|jgi:ribose-phosphate pyrophosphokinase